MKKYWTELLWILVVVGLSGCSVKKENTLPASTKEDTQAEPSLLEKLTTNAYENNILGVRFEYPSDWYMEDEPLDFVTFILSNPDRNSVALEMVPYNYSTILKDTEPETVQHVLEVLSRSGSLSLLRGKMNYSERMQVKIKCIGDVEEQMIGGHPFKKYQFEFTDGKFMSKTLFHAHFFIGTANDMEMLLYYEYTEDNERNILEGILENIVFDPKLTYTTYQNEDLGITLEYPSVWEKENSLEVLTEGDQMGSIPGGKSAHFFNKDWTTDVYIVKIENLRDPNTEMEEIKKSGYEFAELMKRMYESTGAVVTIDDPGNVESVQISSTDFTRVRYELHIENNESDNKETEVCEYYDGIVNGDKYVFQITYKNEPSEVSRIQYLLDHIIINQEIQWKEEQDEEMFLKMSVPSNWQAEATMVDKLRVFVAQHNQNYFSIILDHDQSVSNEENQFIGFEKEMEKRIKKEYENEDGFDYEITNESRTTLLVSGQEFQQYSFNIHISTTSKDFIIKERMILGKYKGGTYTMYGNYDIQIEDTIDKIIQSIVFF